jgi:hypothetical protein
LDEQINQRIAEACGWKPAPRGRWKLNEHVERFRPDYLNDLNAMHEAIMSLTLEDQCNMLEILRKDVLKFTVPTITATAAQRAEAFPRTLNLWNQK